eukprot:15481027-Alexandrium_andersonii.AAC.1
METLNRTQAHGSAWHSWGGGLRAMSAALRTIARGAATRTGPGTLGATAGNGATSDAKTTGARGRLI